MASRATTLEDAPEADEPETPDEAETVAKAWWEHREGKSISTEELKKELGIV